ncbi:Na+/H+ antiporter subunit E [Brucella haematophila]|uniref:Na+/H+ antiporter subunit E n=1 Tax=Brucella haematophila TaxID=419474 RepID=A0ABX1DN60_9HYPH|nr:Na+/H+ antiporter subunit E [Brucella haematophila]KAB2700452.1 Na+/H+ antiporter subunit E [Ochrobactrum sp. Kaboul]NKC04401.1 Na+/H+ antiporter subunit E [Brucella haematophila]TMU91834.1 Na+/H+ antiporter subunit E [Brucella haematophila]
MRKILPYPLLFVSLLLFWLLLNGFTPAQLILGVVIALFACQIMTALQPQKNHIRSIPTMLRLFVTFSLDILSSNITVTRIILSGRKRRPGFVVIPLELENRTALAVLACVVTATPGTAWVDHHSARRELTIHVLDLEEAQVWRDLIKQKYEKPLIAIFGAADVVEKEKSA